MAFEYAEKKRLYYIDWLRLLVILTLIPFHASLTYLRYGVVPIKAPVSGFSALPFLIVEVPLGDFFMTLLFFISGVASRYSFQNKTTGQYIGERLHKLMQPFLLGFLFLCPATAYFQAIYEGFQGGLIEFLPQFFWYGSFHYHGYMHLWFLFYLFVFSVICAPLFKRWQRDESRIDRIGAFFSKGNRLLLPIGFIILLELCLRPFFNTGNYIIVGDWANVMVYLSLFVFGYIFAANPDIQGKLKEYFRPSAVFGILSLAALYYVNINTQMYYIDSLYLTALWILAKGVYECAAIIFLLNLGRQYLNRKSRPLTYLNRFSFTIYIFHYLPVTFFTLIFIKLKIPVLMKFLLVVVLSYITVLLICELGHRASSLKERERG